MFQKFQNIMKLSLNIIEEFLQTHLWGLSLETLFLAAVPTLFLLIIFFSIRRNYNHIKSMIRERIWKYRSTKGLIPYLIVLKERWSFTGNEQQIITCSHLDKLAHFLARIEQYKAFLEKKLPPERIPSTNQGIVHFEYLIDMAKKNIKQGESFRTRIAEYQNYFDFAINQAEHNEAVDDFEPDLENLLLEIQDYLQNSLSIYNETFNETYECNLAETKEKGFSYLLN